MKRHIKTQSNALTALVMLALSSTLLAQEPIKPRLRPTEPKPAAEEPAKPKEGGGIRGGEKPAAPAPAEPAAPVARPVAKEPAAPRAEDIRKMKEEAESQYREKPAPPEGKPVKDPLFPPGVRVPTVKGDKKDPGEPGIIEDEPVKAGEKKEPGAPAPAPVARPAKREPAAPRGGEIPEIKGAGIQKADKKEPSEPAESSEKIPVGEINKRIRPGIDPALRSVCQDFNDGSLQGWLDNLPNDPNQGAALTLLNDTNSPTGTATDGYLQSSDQSGPSWIQNEVDFSGDWRRHYGKCFSFDFRLREDGSTNDPANPNPVRFGFGIYSGGNGGPLNATIRAAFVTTLPVTDTMPWKRFYLPIGPLVGGALPSNAAGTWVMANGAPNSDWTTLMANVKGVFFASDFGPSPTEIIGVDNICITTCGQNPDIPPYTEGSFSFDEAKSTRCGKGTLCFNYTLQKVGTFSGSVSVKLDFYQNGGSAPVASLPVGQPPPLPAGTSTCISFDPATISGLALSAGGFDVVATATFKIGQITQVVTLGNKLEGRVPEKKQRLPDQVR